jgi:hemoglobin
MSAVQDTQPPQPETGTASNRRAATRRDLLEGATLLSAAALAVPLTTSCSNAAEQAPAADAQAGNRPAAGDALYDRLGGIFAIAGVVDYFSDEIIKDPVAGAQSKNPALRRWHTQQLDRLPGLKWMRTLWVAAVSGGPYTFTATKPGSTQLGLEEAHRDLRISSEEFDAVAGVLSRSLDHFEVPQREKDEVLAAFAAHKNEVIAGSRAS